MDQKLLLLAALLGAASLSFAQTDSVRLSDVVVTGTRYQSDIRHLPLDVSVISRSRLTAAYQPSVLPTLSQQVPGLFITTRGILGYGLSTGAAGTIKMRGIGGSADLLVLIDGLPQYAGSTAIRSPTPIRPCSPTAWRWSAVPPRPSMAAMPWAAW